jgi:hypothetical protein
MLMKPLLCWLSLWRVLFVYFLFPAGDLFVYEGHPGAGGFTSFKLPGVSGLKNTSPYSNP